MSRGDPATCPIVCRALRLAHNMAAIEAGLWASCSPAEHSACSSTLRWRRNSKPRRTNLEGRRLSTVNSPLKKLKVAVQRGFLSGSPGGSPATAAPSVAAVVAVGAIAVS